VILMSVLTVVVLAGAALAFVASNRSSGDALPPPAPDNTPVPMTTFKDAETGFTVEYPRAWKKVQVPVADYRLAVDGGSNVAFTIRVVPIQVPATAANLQNFKTVTDGLVASNSTVKVLKEQAISLNGMLGYYYFYTFTDGGVQAVHAHYFLFSGNKMNILVFQTLPDDFEPLAATFDKVAESFRSDPNIPPTSTAPASTTTTVR
jgi:PsbP